MVLPTPFRILIASLFLFLTELPVPINQAAPASCTEQALVRQHVVNNESNQADETEDGKQAELGTEHHIEDVAAQELQQGQ